MWFVAAPVTVWETRAWYRCGASGCIVRAGVEKSSGAVLKLAAGMEALVDASAAASDGTARLRLVEPVVGWCSAKVLERVCVAAIEQSKLDGAENTTIRSRSTWTTSAARSTAPPGDAAAPPSLLGSLEAVPSVMGGANVPVFRVPRGAGPDLGEAARTAAKPEGVPGVAAAIFVADVLSDAQTARLARLSEDLGDYAAERDDGFFKTGTHSRIFLDADGAIRRALEGAVLAAVPNEGDAGWRRDAAGPAPGRLLGCNAKVRFLRYADGDSIQPHVDPAWDACDVEGGVDAVLPDARSWYTVIAYLNDDFSGGETTFYVPSAEGSADYDLVAVAPRRGAVLLFPHGAHRHSPLHEGSEVRGGTKHVLRTDVLYHDDVGAVARTT